ncbi:MAG: hypothetical protein JEZ06_15055 [Anaerolineaceae bacterium]|nr:hypothetical protein [Anaerolineaceae bacterium]
MIDYICRPEGIRKDQWPTVRNSLAILGRGTSTRVELFSEVGVSSGKADRLMGTLRRKQYIDEDVVQLVGSLRLGLVRLTDQGKQTARRYVYQDNYSIPVYSEWERLLDHHQGEYQPRHTSAILYMAYFARMCGWKVEIAPKSSLDGFDPDMLLSSGKSKIYFEFEMADRGFIKNRTDKWYRKWSRQRELQHHIAVCTLTSQRSERYKRLCQENNWRGFITDVTTLRKKAKAGKLQKLDDLYEIFNPLGNAHQQK